MDERLSVQEVQMAVDIHQGLLQLALELLMEEGCLQDLQFLMVDQSMDDILLGLEFQMEADTPLVEA